MSCPLNEVADEMRASVLNKMPSACKKLRGNRKTFEFEGIASRINDEECSPFAKLTRKANSR
jgi:hypothetical protein